MQRQNQGFEGYSDEELVKMSQAGDKTAEEYLLSRYRPLVMRRLGTYYLIGAERDDLFQEGMIGLHKAIRDYKPDKAVSLKSFAMLCILRQILTAVKTANRQKHLPLGSYVTLTPDSDDEIPIEIPSEGDPNDEMIHREGIEGIKKALKQALSPFEWEVFRLYLRGLSYEEMGETLKRSPKSIDNALSRIREKGRILRIEALLS